MPKLPKFHHQQTLDPELNALFSPAQVFAHPMDVVRDDDLTLYEKRAILSSWASDACAVGSAPTLRAIPGQNTIIQFDEIVDALKSLEDNYKAPWKVERSRIGSLSRSRNKGSGSMPLM
jgi:hypothetical protein